MKIDYCIAIIDIEISITMSMMRYCKPEFRLKSQTALIAVKIVLFLLTFEPQETSWGWIYCDIHELLAVYAIILQYLWIRYSVQLRILHGRLLIYCGSVWYDTWILMPSLNYITVRLVLRSSPEAMKHCLDIDRILIEPSPLVLLITNEVMLDSYG